MARPMENRVDSARRDTPEAFIRYWCSSPYHFQCTFGKPLSEANIIAELKRQFPGRVFEAPEREQGGAVMAKKGKCANCHEGRDDHT